MAPLSVPNPDTDLRDRGCAQLRGNFFALQFFSDKDPSCLHNPFYFTQLDLILFFNELSGIWKIRIISKVKT